MTEISLDRVVEIVRAAGVHAYVEQTGGGTATIFAGATRETTDGTRYAAVAGPGHFAGPGWTDGRGDTVDFYVGPDVEDGAGYTATADVGAHTAEHVAALILAQARRADVTTGLSHDDVEALGLDGTGRGL